MPRSHLRGGVRELKQTGTRSGVAFRVTISDVLYNEPTRGGWPAALGSDSVLHPATTDHFHRGYWKLYSLAAAYLPCRSSAMQATVISSTSLRYANMQLKYFRCAALRGESQAGKACRVGWLNAWSISHPVSFCSPNNLRWARSYMCTGFIDTYFEIRKPYVKCSSAYMLSTIHISKYAYFR